MAQEFHALFPRSDLFLLPGARHFVQMDEPKEVARLILLTWNYGDCATCTLRARLANDLDPLTSARDHREQ